MVYIKKIFKIFKKYNTEGQGPGYSHLVTNLVFVLCLGGGVNEHIGIQQGGWLTSNINIKSMVPCGGGVCYTSVEHQWYLFIQVG